MSQPPEYAPTASTSFTISSKSSKFNQEISRSSLIKSPLNKVVYNSLAEISSILVSIEVLENSFLKDYITDKEKYTSTAYRLIYQYQIILKGFDELKLFVLRELMPDLSPDLSNFLALFTSKFNLSCPQAVNRLLSGVPSTIDHVSDATAASGASATSKANARLIAEITGNFITCMDAVKLNYKTRDQLHPLLSDLVVNLNEFNESIEFNGKSKLINWLIKINNLEKELSQEDSDLFLNDLDIAYKGFYTSLENH